MRPDTTTSGRVSSSGPRSRGQPHDRMLAAATDPAEVAPATLSRLVVFLVASSRRHGWRSWFHDRVVAGEVPRPSAPSRTNGPVTAPRKPGSAAARNAKRRTLGRRKITTNWKQALAHLALVYPERLNPYL